MIEDVGVKVISVAFISGMATSLLIIRAEMWWTERRRNRSR